MWRQKFCNTKIARDKYLIYHILHDNIKNALMVMAVIVIIIIIIIIIIIVILIKMTILIIKKQEP